MYLPKVSIIASSAFYGCPQLVSINIDSAEIINGNAFNGCESLASIIIPNVISIGGSTYQEQYAFTQCINLSVVIAPKL